MMYLEPELSTAFNHGDDLFQVIFNLQGEVYKELDGRRTLRFCCADKHYFLKAHSGVGWREIVKNLVQLRLPVIGAKNEWQAIPRLRQLGIATAPLVGYGQRGLNPARRQSFVITAALENMVTLESFCLNSYGTNDRTQALLIKRWLLSRVAWIARTLHRNGLNHRDFYLCHFLLNPTVKPDNLAATELFLMDLHRVQIRPKIPRRWQVKDLGSLYFSAMDIDLSKRDLLRFIRSYSGGSLRTILTEQDSLWRAVDARAQRMYRSFHQGKYSD